MSDLISECSFKEKNSKLESYHENQTNFISNTCKGLRHLFHIDEADFTSYQCKVPLEFHV